MDEEFVRKPARELAYHEAGHAVVCGVLGVPTERVWIGGEDDDERGSHRPAEGAGVFPGMQPRDWWRVAVYSLAGRAAEYLLTGREPQHFVPDDDMRRRGRSMLDHDKALLACWLSLQSSLPGPDPRYPDHVPVRLPQTEDERRRTETRYEEAYEEAKALVFRHWSAVGAVASALLDRGRLNGAEVRRILEAAA